jgi:hypothetical protein
MPITTGVLRVQIHMTEKKRRKRRRILGWAALFAIAGCTGYLVLCGQLHAQASTLAPEAALPAVTADSPVKVVAYYFHVTVRCVTCRTIESYSREAIEQGFAKELRDGTVEWRPVNVQLQENRHFIRDYQLYTRSLVLAKIRGGKQVEWRNLEKVWDLVRRKGDFLRYVQSNVKAYLGDS